MNNDGLAGLFMILVILYLIVEVIFMIMLYILAAVVGAITLAAIALVLFYGIALLRDLITRKYEGFFGNIENLPGINFVATSAVLCTTVTVLAGITFLVVWGFQGRIFAESARQLNDIGFVLALLWAALLGGAYVGIMGSLIAREFCLVIKWLVKRVFRRERDYSLIFPLGTLIGSATAGIAIWEKGTENIGTLILIALGALVLLVLGWSLANFKEWKFVIENRE